MNMHACIIGDRFVNRVGLGEYIRTNMPVIFPNIYYASKSLQGLRLKRITACCLCAMVAQATKAAELSNLAQCASRGKTTCRSLLAKSWPIAIIRLKYRP